VSDSWNLPYSLRIPESFEIKRKRFTRNLPGGIKYRFTFPLYGPEKKPIPIVKELKTDSIVRIYGELNNRVNAKYKAIISFKDKTGGFQNRAYCFDNCWKDLEKRLKKEKLRKREREKIMQVICGSINIDDFPSGWRIECDFEEEIKKEYCAERRF